MTAPVALVTGATGAVGPALVSHLRSKGYVVRTLSRAAVPIETSNPGTRHFSGTITDAALLDSALENVDVVFHLAALLHIENPGTNLTAEYHRINVEGTRLVAERSVRAGIKRLIYFSTVKVYGSRRRLPIVEDFPPSPKSIYAQSKLQGESAVQAVTNLDSVTLRLSPVYGPRLKGSWERLVRTIARGRFLPIGNLSNVHSLTHVDDVARASLIAAEHQDAAGRIFNVVGHESPTMQEILTAIYTANDRVLPQFRVPSFLALLGAYSLEKSLGLIGKRSQVTVDAIRQLTEDETYSGQSLYRLGFSPSVELRKGWSGISPDD